MVENSATIPAASREVVGRSPVLGAAESLDRHRRLAAALGLREKALLFLTAVGRLNTPMTVTDPGLLDNPIVFANRAFLELTGYEDHELLGRNCRLPQGRDTDLATVEEIRRTIAEEREHTTKILNYRKNDHPF